MFVVHANRKMWAFIVVVNVIVVVVIARVIVSQRRKNGSVYLMSFFAVQKSFVKVRAFDQIVMLAKKVCECCALQKVQGVKITAQE